MTWGSSPLARGLHVPVAVGAPRGRIIPARAGFTRRRAPGAARGRDHPRSRGVYSAARLASFARLGSSPLARGLQGGENIRRDLRGIIPARAGFTHAVLRVHGVVGDHPRSRGVYQDLADIYAGEKGSSPLARGLLPATDYDGRDRGIIPARAGFTPGLALRCAHRRDHPRSRGVYGSAPTGRSGSQGSSPLARGLPPVSGEESPADGIIPARAGFTGERVRFSRGARDHPRSRGVYPGRRRGRRWWVGSSPLARGLLRSAMATDAPARIIPARAGFTRRPTRRGSVCTDHPRSRGVYCGTLPPMRSTDGSSPLARGLRRRRTAGRCTPRIIPARAGFTAEKGISMRECRDHPRSRGVYPP